ncbi:hypothetical protein NX722_01905 [Endozoicomonas gorgoniicola]|uniref:DUF1439 domain-containing protein n=1 Tax=Endozoicomonas gorgoniicola TaxID=1234144 RepID=A0ABT3MQU4_9GAMM|nr:hypothetical protein [Endozoicomonas gorgoniicola]MCW7551414.1 hypothetical protein [Endozoicomonas gorgoniicola]
MKKLVGFWSVPFNLSLALVFSLLAMFAGCSQSRSVTLTSEELQALVDQKFMSPQIRNLKVLPPIVNVQLYLETPKLTLHGDYQAIGFQFRGTLDADVFSNYLDGGVTDPVPFQVEGIANLEYRPDDRAFFFSNILLEKAHIDLDIAMIETLMIDQLKKALRQELGSLPIIPLDDGDALYRKLGSLPAAVRVEQGKVVITPKVSEGS